MAVTASNNPSAIMSYENMHRDIVRRYGIKLVGWPESVPFVNPSALGSQIPLLETLLDALETDECKFVRLSSRELQAEEAEFMKSVDGGDVVLKERKKRKDAGTKRKTQHTTRKASSPDEVSDLEEDKRPAKKAKSKGEQSAKTKSVTANTSAAGDATPVPPSTAQAAQHMPQAPILPPLPTTTSGAPQASQTQTQRPSTTLPAAPPPPFNFDFTNPAFGMPPFPYPYSFPQMFPGGAVPGTAPPFSQFDPSVLPGSSFFVPPHAPQNVLSSSNNVNTAGTSVPSHAPSPEKGASAAPSASASGPQAVSVTKGKKRSSVPTRVSSRRVGGK